MTRTERGGQDNHKSRSDRKGGAEVPGGPAAGSNGEARRLSAPGRRSPPGCGHRSGDDADTQREGQGKDAGRGGIAQEKEGEIPGAPPDRDAGNRRTQGAGSPAAVQAAMIPDEGQPAPGEAPETLGRTTITQTRLQSIIVRDYGSIGAYDGVINPRTGCSFGCSYCYASNFTHSTREKQEWGRWVKVKAGYAPPF